MPWWVRKSGLLTAACAGGTIPEKEYLQKLRIAGLTECNVVARQYYEPTQMASSVLESLPKIVKNLSCCGKSLVKPLLVRVAKPISKNLWSSKFSGKVS